MNDRRGLIAAGHPAVAEAAGIMLRTGGNAFDAAVAAGFASAFCEPAFTSLAGGGFLLARVAGGRGAHAAAETTLFDFFVDTPGRGLPPGALSPAFEAVTVEFAAAQQAFHCGLGSVAVPGNLAGYLHIHRRLGRLPLAEVVAPAVALGRSGVAVAPTQALDFALLAPILLRTDACRSIFAPRGRLLGSGDHLENDDLATFIERLGDDPTKTFYGGVAGSALVHLMSGADDGPGGGHGMVTAADLAAYRVIERRPLTVAYRDHIVLTNPSPSFGGTLIARALALLGAEHDLPPAGSPESAAQLVRVMADVDRHREVEHALRSGISRPVATRGTTHVSVADAEGNVASMTTSNGECSGDVIPGTGVLLNNMLGEDDLHPDGFHAAPPGVRVSSMMSPTLVTAPDGTIVLALGSGGSKRIRSAIVQVLVGVFDHHLPLTDAVDRPRLHWDGDHIEIEPGFDAAVIDALRSVARVNVWPDRSLYFGGVHAIAPAAHGRLAQTAGDSRRGGATLVVA